MINDLILQLFFKMKKNSKKETHTQVAVPHLQRFYQYNKYLFQYSLFLRGKVSISKAGNDYGQSIKYGSFTLSRYDRSCNTIAIC